MMDRKTYITDTYAKYWRGARKNIYGFMEYDKALLKYITEHCNQQKGRTLEVGVGTGYPFADYLSNAGYEVHGIDLSPELIRESEKTNPNIRCKVGDAEQLEYPDTYFDFVYCVHSSWYIPDLHKAVGEMLRVVRPGGGILLDMQNIRNEYISSLYKAHIFYNSHWAGMALKTVKNIVKFITRHGIQDWPFVVSEVPTDPVDIIRYLNGKNTIKITVLARLDDGSVTIVEDTSSSFTPYDRLIFHIIK